MTLLEQLKSSVTPQLTGYAAKLLGESPAKIEKAVALIIPAVLSAAATAAHATAGHKGGANSLVRIVSDPVNDGSLLSRLPTLYQGTMTSAPIYRLGSQFLQTIFGAKTVALTQAVAATAGIKQQSSALLVNTLAPHILSIIGKRHRLSGDATAYGLANLLDTEQAAAAAALPATLRELLPAPATIAKTAAKAAVASGPAAVASASHKHHGKDEDDSERTGAAVVASQSVPQTVVPQSYKWSSWLPIFALYGAGLLGLALAWSAHGPGPAGSIEAATPRATQTASSTSQTAAPVKVADAKADAPKTDAAKTATAAPAATAPVAVKPAPVPPSKKPDAEKAAKAEASAAPAKSAPATVESKPTTAKVEYKAPAPAATTASPSAAGTKTAAKAEPSKNEASKAEASKVEASKAESSKLESPKTEPAKTDAAKTEPAKPEAAKPVIPKPDTAKAAVASAEEVKTEANPYKPGIPVDRIGDTYRPEQIASAPPIATEKAAEKADKLDKATTATAGKDAKDAKDKVAKDDEKVLVQPPPSRGTTTYFGIQRRPPDPPAVTNPDYKPAPPSSETAAAQAAASAPAAANPAPPVEPAKPSLASQAIDAVTKLIAPLAPAPSKPAGTTTYYGQTPPLKEAPARPNPDYKPAGTPPQATATIVSTKPAETVVAKTPPALALCQAVLAKAVRGKRIIFRSSRAELRGNSDTILDRVAAAVKTCPNYSLKVEGHTDNTGSASLNQTLSQERAEAVTRALAAKGIDPKRLLATGMGSARPVAPNTTALNKALNRRIEFSINAS